MFSRLAQSGENFAQFRVFDIGHTYWMRHSASPPKHEYCSMVLTTVKCLTIRFYYKGAALKAKINLILNAVSPKPNNGLKNASHQLRLRQPGTLMVRIYSLHVNYFHCRSNLAAPREFNGQNVKYNRWRKPFNCIQFSGVRCRLASM